MNMVTQSKSGLNDRIGNWVGGKAFNLVHKNNLVYNTCWEDPRLDRIALDIQPDDKLMMITSAGCNALDYLLDEPREIHCVDMNPRQNALLELKIAAIQTLEYDDFFSLFGRGHLEGFHNIYLTRLRRLLSPSSQLFWDKRTKFFDSKLSFYFRGSSGSVAKFCNYYIDHIAKIREPISRLFAAQSLDEQKAIYSEEVKEAFWGGLFKSFIGRSTTLSLLGVPGPQRHQVATWYRGGVAEFVERCLDAVFTSLPIHDNYFWRVYVTGEYTKDCCPEYLKEKNFERLKDGLVERIHLHTATIEKFLLSHDQQISKFILLDHMDWLSTHRLSALADEWQSILLRATDEARVIFRSGGMEVNYVDPLEVKVHGRMRKLETLLEYDTALSEELHEKDRVHTYGSFYIATIHPQGKWVPVCS